MKMLFLFFGFLTFSQILSAGPVIRFSDVTGGGSGDELVQNVSCDHWRCARSCKNLHSKVVSALGGKAVDCMMQLFYTETTCNPKTQEKARNKKAGPNPNAGFGLCTIEARADLRAKRGPNCRAASLSNVDAQIKCCRDMMRDTGKRSIKKSYFGPVRRGEVQKCL